MTLLPLLLWTFSQDPLPEGAVARLGTARFRVSRSVQCLAFSPDGKTLAADDHLFEVSTGRRLQVLDFLEASEPLAIGSIEDVAFLPDGKRLVTADSVALRIWDLATGKEIKKVFDGKLNGARLSPDEKTLVYGELEGLIHVTDAASRKELLKLSGRPNRISQAFAFAPDSAFLVCGDKAGNVRVWERKMEKIVAELKEHGNEINSIAFSPDGRLFGAVDISRHVAIWQTGTWKNILGSTAGGAYSLTFSPDGKTFSSAGSNEIFIQEVSTGNVAWKTTTPRGLTTAGCFSPDGKTFATAVGEGVTGESGAVLLWDAVTGKQIRPDEGHWGWVEAVEFSPDGRHVATGSKDGTVILWETSTAKSRFAVDGHVFTFSSDGNALFVVGEFLDFSEWDVLSGKRKSFTRGRTAQLIAQTLDGKLVGLVAERTQKVNAIHLQDLTHGTQISEFKTPVDPGKLVALTSDGRYLLSNNFNVMFLWDVRTGELVLRRDPPNEKVLFEITALSRDGRILATLASTEKEVRIFETASGKELARLPAVEGWHSAAFSTDGALLAAGGSGVVVWELATGRRLIHRDDRGGSNYSIAFSPDGRRLVSGSTDCTALVWEVPRKEAAPKDADAKALWGDLASAEPSAAFKAVWALAVRGEEMARLVEQLPERVADERSRKLVSRLDDDDAAARDKAERDLSATGETAEPALLAALDAVSSAEQRQRIVNVLDRLNVGTVSDTEHLRWLRAVWVLELARDKRLLELLAVRAPWYRVRREAQVAIERLVGRY